MNRRNLLQALPLLALPVAWPTASKAADPNVTLKRLLDMYSQLEREEWVVDKVLLNENDFIAIEPQAQYSKLYDRGSSKHFYFGGALVQRVHSAGAGVWLQDSGGSYHLFQWETLKPFVPLKPLGK